MNKNIIEIILNDINYSKTNKNKDLIKNILNENDKLAEIWDKIPTLIKNINHTTGFISISNKKNMIKISYKKDKVSEKIKEEFHSIVNNWSKKYKIDLDYDCKSDQYYIK